MTHYCSCYPVEDSRNVLAGVEKTCAECEARVWVSLGTLESVPAGVIYLCHGCARAKLPECYLVPPSPEQLKQEAEYLEDLC